MAKTEEQEEGEGPVSVGRLNIGERYQVEDSTVSERNDMRVGKLKKDIWGSSSERGEQEVCGESVKLRGARRISKGKTERKCYQQH